MSLKKDWVFVKLIFSSSQRVTCCFWFENCSLPVCVRFCSDRTQRERKVWTRDPIGKRETPSENNCNKYVSLQWHCPDANYDRIKIIATMIAENENGTLYSIQNFDYSQWSEFWWYQLQWLFCWRFADRINLAVWFPIMVSIDWLTFGSLTWLIKLEYFVDHIKKCER